MIFFVFLFSLPLLALVLYLAVRIVRELAAKGLRGGFLTRALYGSDENAARVKRDRRGCIMVALGGFFFFVGYWIALFSLFSSAFLLFFIGVAILVVGMIISLRPLLSR